MSNGRPGFLLTAGKGRTAGRPSGLPAVHSYGGSIRRDGGSFRRTYRRKGQREAWPRRSFRLTAAG